MDAGRRHGPFSGTNQTGMVDLGRLPGHVAGTSVATAVGPSGEVVGYDTGASGDTTHAFFWTKQDGMVDLGTPPGTDESFAIKRDGMVNVGPSTGIETRPHAVSTTGHVVGITDSTSDHHRHAFSWTERSGLIDLGTFGGS